MRPKISCPKMYLNNRSVITTNVFIQDNGPEIQIYLKSVTAINSTTGEIKCFDCQYQDSLPEGWTEVQDTNDSKGHPKRPEYFQKQPHYAVLVDDLSLPVEYQDQVKAQILSKFPGMDVQKLLVVKSTEGSELLKLNSLIRVTGILEFPVIKEWDPELDTLYYLPTIHIQDSKEITLTQMLSQYDHELDLEAVAAKLQDASITKFDRAGLTKVFKNAVGGDLLAAEYLVCQLFHSTSTRMGGVPTSKFNLNVYGNHLSPSKISEVISQVWPLVSVLEFSIKGLNEVEMQSCQTETGLKMGQLQKPNHSVFIIDETMMSEGVLNSTGIDNVKAVQHCIDYQSVEYKIPYGQFETESNFNFLMIGREPSLLQVFQFLQGEF